MSEPMVLTEPTKVARAAPRGMLIFRGDISDTALRDDLERAIGLAFPPRLGISSEGDVAIAWMGPEEYLIFCPDDRRASLASVMQTAVQGASLLLVDMSDARVQFDLTGGPLREVLARLTPADVSPRGLPLMTFRRSHIGQVGAAFWLSSETTGHVLCFRSVADYMESLLETTARHAQPLGLFVSQVLKL